MRCSTRGLGAENQAASDPAPSLCWAAHSSEWGVSDIDIVSLMNKPRQKDLELCNVCFMSGRGGVYPLCPSLPNMWWECSARQRCSTGFLKGLEAQVSSRCLCLVLRAWKWLGRGVSVSFCEHFPSSCFASAVKASLKQQELTLSWLWSQPLDRLRAGGNLQLSRENWGRWCEV